MIFLNCQQCGRVFSRYPSQVKAGRSKFCSVKCKAEWQSIHLKGDNNPNYGNHPIPWNKGKTKGTDSRVLAYSLKLKGKRKSKETIEKMKRSLKGRNVWNRGKKGIYSKESREKMRKRKKRLIAQGWKPWIAGKTMPEEFSEKLSKALKGRKAWNKGKRTRIKKICPVCGKSFRVYPHLKNKRKFCSHSCAMKDSERQKIALKGLFKRPTKPEKKMIELICSNRFPFKYVGNGKVMINGKCPDFISTDGTKKIIEVFGDVFHDPEKTFLNHIPFEQTEQGRKVVFAEAGFDTLIVWQHELDDDVLVSRKIMEFINDD